MREKPGDKNPEVTQWVQEKPGDKNPEVTQWVRDKPGDKNLEVTQWVQDKDIKISKKSEESEKSGKK